MRDLLVRPTGERMKTDESMRNRWRIDSLVRPTGERMRMDESMRKAWRSDLIGPPTDETTKASKRDDLTKASR